MKRDVDVFGVMVVVLVIAILAVILVPAYHDYMCRKSGAADCAEQKAKRLNTNKLNTLGNHYHE